MPPNWYVLRSKDHKEAILYKQLLKHELEVFYPYLCVKPVNPRSAKERPYFPSYLFVRVEPDIAQSSFFEYMPFAQGLVRFGDDAAIVPVALIDAIRRKVSSVNNLFSQVSIYQKGEEIVVKDGLFEGYKGIFDICLPGKDRARVLIELLGKRQMSVEMPVWQIQKAT